MRARHRGQAPTPGQGCHDGGDAPCPGLRIAEQYNVIWALWRTLRGNIRMGVITSLCLISNISGGIDEI